MGRAAGGGSIVSRRVPLLGRTANYVPSPCARCQICLTSQSRYIEMYYRQYGRQPFMLYSRQMLCYSSTDTWNTNFVSQTSITVPTVQWRSWHNVVGVVTKIQPGRFSNTGRGKKASVSKSSRPSLWPTQPPIQRAPGFLPRCKAARAWRWPLRVVPRLRMNGAVLLLPLYAFTVWPEMTLL